MADREKKGLIARWLEGKERSEDYARSTLPTSRWALFWDIFKGRFGKLVLVNLLMLVTFLPLAAVIVWRILAMGTQQIVGPYGAGLGVGYPVIPNVSGVAEMTVFEMDLLFFVLFIPAGAIAALGISGGGYIIRNLIWTEGIFVANDFWRGIKINFIVVLQSTVFYGVMLYLFTISINWSQYMLAVGTGNAVLNNISIALSYIAIGIVTLMFLWMLSMGGNYKLKFFQLLKNSFLMTFGLIFQNVFFVVLMAIPVILVLLGSFFQMIGFVILVLFGISYMLLVWFNYSQWAFDKFFESKREGGKVNRGIYAKVGKGGEQSKAVQEYQASIEAARSVKSDLSSRPIKPITDDLKVYELPESYSREDLAKLRESKNKIVEDTEQYAEEHKDDEKYVVYNAQFEKPKEEEADEKGKKKKKPKKSDGQGEGEDAQ